jgi:hypothetical protein
MAEFEAELAEAIAALASDAAALAASLAAGLLQAATVDRAAMAAPAIRIERSVEVIVPGPKWMEDGGSANRDAGAQYDEFGSEGKREFTAA